MSEAKRIKKRWARENRHDKQGTWGLFLCGRRHKMGERCMVPKVAGNIGLDMALLRLGVR